MADRSSLRTMAKESYYIEFKFIPIALFSALAVLSDGHRVPHYGEAW